MENTFLDVQVKGFFFHLVQNMHKHPASLGFTNSFNNTNPDFALNAEVNIAIAYAAWNMIDEYVDVLATELPQKLNDLLNWFEGTYVGRPNR